MKSPNSGLFIIILYNPLNLIGLSHNQIPWNLVDPFVELFHNSLQHSQFLYMANSSQGADSSQAADSISCNECEYKWTRVSATVVSIEFSSYSDEEGEMPGPFKQEGLAPGLEKSSGKEVEIINLTCSAKLCVNKDDPLYRCNFTANPKDASGK